MEYFTSGDLPPWRTFFKTFLTPIIINSPRMKGSPIIHSIKMDSCMLRLLLKQNSTFDKTTRGKKGIEEHVVGRYRTRALKKIS